MWESKSSSKFDFVFKHEASLLPEWAVVKYYQSLRPDQIKEMLFEAASTFWAASIDYQRTNNLMSARFKAIESIEALEITIENYRSVLEIDQPIETRPVLKLGHLKKDPIKFEFRCQGKVNSFFHLVVQFFENEESPLSRYLKVLYPSTLYWGWLIGWQSKIISHDFVKEMGIYSIWQIHRHIEFLERRFIRLENDSLANAPSVVSFNQPRAIQLNQNEDNQCTSTSSMKSKPSSHSSNSTVVTTEKNSDNDDDNDLSWLLEKGPLDDFAQSLANGPTQLN